jgi:hypothetical protein
MRNLHNKELKDSTLLIVWVAIIVVGHGKSKATNNLKELKAILLLIVWVAIIIVGLGKSKGMNNL